MELETRKLKEIEHSDRRRQIVKGYEYLTDCDQDDMCRDYVQNEKEFEREFSNTKFYSIAKSSFAYRDKILFADIKDKVALDYCCGNGEIALAMAQYGAKEVHGIDISQVAVDNATELSKQKNVEDICNFQVMDAENMSYEDSSIDVIHEYGALHHLDLTAAFTELSRVLKPDGKLICTEALRHNPLIHQYRKRTMHLRTEWEVEHILGVPEIMMGKKHFNDVKINFFHLAALAAVPFRKTFLFKPLLKAFNGLDGLITNTPYLRRFSWVAVIEYSSPKK